jgi:uncharacterized Zn finger protein
MRLPRITESAIRAQATPESFQRGKEYFQQGAISNAALQGNMLTGDCAGTSAPFYRVRVEMDEAGIRSASCTCPYEYGGYCKHIVALLLNYLHNPREFTVRQDPAELVADLDREDLLALVTKLIERDPGLYDFVQAALSVPTRSTKSHRKKPDLEVHRRQIRNILHSPDGLRPSEAYWHVGGLANELRGVEETARKFLDHGDAETALAILLTLLEEVGDGIEYVDDSDGELGGFANELGLPLAEAILSLEMSAVEREKLVKRLEKLDKHLGDYGMDYAIPMAMQAAKYGWNDVPDAQVDREDDESEEEGWDDDEYSDEEHDYWTLSVPIGDLTEAKLNVLERKGKTDEYLLLCQKEERYQRYVLKLCELKRVPEAVKFAAKHLREAGEALAVAQKLRELEHFEEAITIAEDGLRLEGAKARLGEWLGPIQESRGETERAFDAWLATFTEQPSVDIYKALKRLAEPTWNKRRPPVMALLKKSQRDDVLAEIHLFEGEWDEAIKIADKPHTWYAVTATVADAVIQHRPEWVIRVSIKEAEALIAKTQSKYYHHAAEWLARAKKAYAQLDQADEWRAFLEQLKEKYKRRPALQEQLRRL